MKFIIKGDQTKQIKLLISMLESGRFPVGQPFPDPLAQRLYDAMSKLMRYSITCEKKMRDAQRMVDQALSGFEGGSLDGDSVDFILRNISHSMAATDCYDNVDITLSVLHRENFGSHKTKAVCASRALLKMARDLRGYAPVFRLMFGDSKESDLPCYDVIDLLNNAAKLLVESYQYIEGVVDSEGLE